MIRSVGTSLSANLSLHPRVALLLAVTAISVGAAACDGGGGTVQPGVDGGVDGLNDHTRPALASVAEFESMTQQESSLPSLKIVVTSFDDAAARDVRFMDGRFYSLHDEWYWFRLLNGARVPGDATPPVVLSGFATLLEIYAWAHTQSTLPLDLLFTSDGRLYSPRFYEQSFGATREFGLATLVRIPARTVPTPQPERWAFELEFGDAVTHEQLVRFFDAIAQRLPAEIGGHLMFLVRSAEHEALAQRMEAEHLQYWDRIVRYSDLVVPGAREVYSEGITAGRLRFIRRGDSYDRTASTDILVFEEIPDRLPPGAGVITAVPQTPLAHINILARNRGIPNAYMAGVLEDVDLQQLARGYAPVIYDASLPDHVVLKAMNEAQYARYRSLVTRPSIVVESPPVEDMPYLMDLEAMRPEDGDGLATTIGGKCLGMLALAHVEGVERPDHPQALTIRAYVEHLAPLRAEIEHAIADTAFANDARIRYLVLEGVDAYRASHAVASDLAFADTFLAERNAEDPLGKLARQGGVRGLVTSTAMNAATLEMLRNTLRTRFSDLAVTQGIRFRSSSNVEDIEGFNGAGLYESFTGFIDADAQPRASDRTKTVERAIKAAWASYWGFEAFEERRIERVEHLSGAMALLVHPRFDDPLERATGVFTFSILPPTSSDERVLEVNVQKGDESVANPNPSILPEVERVSRARGETALRIERMRRSTLSPEADLLSDDALREMFADAERVTQIWLDRQNAHRTPEQRGRSLTLDFEFHDMQGGWPAMHDGATRPARLVFKQARTLEPGLRSRDPELAALPVPREVLARARRIDELRCMVAPQVVGDATVSVQALRVLTDASLTPDVGYSARPFFARLRAQALDGPVTALGWPSGTDVSVTYLAFSAETSDTQTTLRIDAASPAHERLSSVTFGAADALALRSGEQTLAATATCTTNVLLASARDYLLALLETAP